MRYFHCLKFSIIMIKIQYAFKDGIRYDINDPLVQTGQRYTWIDNGIEYEVYPAKGEIKNNHFRSMPGVIIDANRIFHKHCQFYIEDCKGIWIDDYSIVADKVLMEHEAAEFIKRLIPKYKMIPDCLLIDKDNNILCIIEVNVTHQKSEDDIKKIQEYKIITYELTYGKEKTDYINPIGIAVLYGSEEKTECDAIRNRIRNKNERIRSAGDIVQQQQDEIESIELLLIKKLVKNYEQSKQNKIEGT